MRIASFVKVTPRDGNRRGRVSWLLRIEAFDFSAEPFGPSLCCQTTLGTQRPIPGSSHNSTLLHTTDNPPSGRMALLVAPLTGQMKLERATSARRENNDCTNPPISPNLNLAIREGPSPALFTQCTQREVRLKMQELTQGLVFVSMNPKGPFWVCLLDPHLIGPASNLSGLRLDGCLLERRNEAPERIPNLEQHLQPRTKPLVFRTWNKVGPLDS